MNPKERLQELHNKEIAIRATQKANESRREQLLAEIHEKEKQLRGLGLTEDDLKDLPSWIKHTNEQVEEALAQAEEHINKAQSILDSNNGI